ncbi:hypothetical protein BGZ47_000518 [Haplosporangium gracile]|nr:hypothetical protein BGZ47_000518 [Haplosporangium gracile]
MVKKSAGKAAVAPATSKATKPIKKAAKFAPIAKPSITAQEDSEGESDNSAAEEEDSDVEDLDNKEAEGGRTMEEKLQDMNSKAKSSLSTTSQPTKTSTAPVSSRTTAPTSTPANKYATPKANDLQQTLLQALHTSDAALLDACLHFSHPVTALRNTIRRVATVYITPLLTTLLNQYQQKPNQNAHLIEWIKAILLIHSSFLMSNHELVKRLSSFYGAIEARVPVYQKVLNLNGRLDLIMNQIEMRKQYEQGEGEDEVVYVEDEEQQVEEEDLDHAGAMDDDDDDDLVGETDAFEDEENGETDEEELESDMSEDDDDVSDDE